VAGSFPVVWWLTVHPLRFSGKVAEAYARFGLEPIFPATLRPSVLLQQALWVWAVAAILAWIPVWRAFRIRPLEAMRK
jgi:ABC-type lipoprotein release transport system permease subunit